MLDLFSKNAREITIADVEELVRESAPEDERLEFKQDLPCKHGSDPWHSGKKEIGERARNELLEEIIAFANAYGGCLILGMGETKQKPARAERITPIARCAELAGKLEHQIRDCIEPKLPIVHVLPLPTVDDGAGVVVVRVGASRLRPHRLKTTRECLIRRSDRTEMMTMREIQDLTLLAYFGSQRIEERFSAKRREFQERIAEIEATPHGKFLAIRVTAIPTGTPLQVPRVHNLAELRPAEGWPHIRVNDGKPYALPHPVSVDYRPIIRATCGTSERACLPSRRTELHCDGTLQTEFVPTTNGESRLYADHVLSMVINAVRTCDRFRTFVGAPDAEYGLELEIVHTTDNPPFYELGERPFSSGAFQSRQSLFPRYSIGSVDELGALATVVYADLRDAAGIRFDANLSITVDAMRT